MAEEAQNLPELDPIRDNATAEDFKTKNKVYELILYTNPEIEQFPRAQRKLADDIRETMLSILRLVVTLENKHYKKTTLGELDNEVDVLRHLIRLAADPQYTRSRKKRVKACFFIIWEITVIEDLPCLSGVRVSTTLPTVALRR